MPAKTYIIGAFWMPRLAKVPPRRGFALRDVIINSQPHSSTYLGKAVTEIDCKAIV